MSNEQITHYWQSPKSFCRLANLLEIISEYNELWSSIHYWTSWPIIQTSVSLIVIIRVTFHKDKQINVSLTENYIKLYISKNGVSSVFITDSITVTWEAKWKRRWYSDAQVPSLPFSINWLTIVALKKNHFSSYAKINYVLPVISMMTYFFPVWTGEWLLSKYIIFTFY